MSYNRRITRTHCVHFVVNIKILGVSLDSMLNLNKHISITCRTVYMHLRRINSIRPYLTEEAWKIPTQSVVISRLDCCNSIFVGMPLNAIRKLQLAHTCNAAARVVQKTPPRAHMTPILRQLHWLPVMKRCQFKLLTITFKSLHDDAPEYIQNLVNRYHPRRQLRSVNDILLTPNGNRTVKYGRRLMDTAAASLWNPLPIDIKNALNIVSFKKMLKTHLF